MENRQYNGQAFYSECLDLETTIKNIIEEKDDFVDFYIFLDKEIRGGKKIISFHVPFSYVKEYIDSSQYYYSNYDNPLKEELIHQELLECLIDDTKSIEVIYVMFIQWFSPLLIGQFTFRLQ